jgi:hypothetical protein
LQSVQLLISTSLKDADGDILYFWTIRDTGVHFEYQSFGDPSGGFPMDVETRFTMPTSEYPNLYTMFNIDPAATIKSALEEISDSGRGELLSDAFGESIAIVDKFVWMN